MNASLQRGFGWCAVSLALVAALLVVNVAQGQTTAQSPQGRPDGELLYNGIRLPQPWPPKLKELTREPMALAYLERPPAVIPIDVGRQLFVDGFLVEKTTLRRTFHQARQHPDNPVLKPDKPWEKQGRMPTAMVFSDGVWYDPQDKLFKMWYMGGYVATTCYAFSKDGIHWEKPSLDIEPGTNVVVRGWRDSSTVWLDSNDRDPQRRWKMFCVGAAPQGKGWAMALRVSPDGIHWGKPAAYSPNIGDRTTVFFNPFCNVWVYSLRIGAHGRARAYREHPDAVAGMKWLPEDVRLWVESDRLDPHHPKPEFSKIDPQLYNLDAVAYESVLVGLFSVWQWPGTAQIPKRNEVLLGFSRDGFHWDRPDRRPFIGADESEGAWNWGNVQSAGGGCLVVGDQLYFYFSGRARSDSRWHNDCSTGLATLRRDGFASMDAGSDEGILTTRPVSFKGKHLMVNVDAAKGELRAEVLGPDGQPVEPFTRANCAPLRVDKTLAPVTWKGAEDLSAVAGKPVRFRFHLRNGSLYAFWVSPAAGGASHGYVAAGGPGLTGPADTVGAAAYGKEIAN